MELKAHEYRADGVVMRYYTAGQGRSLLFLHGGGVKAMTYRKNLELFARGFFVIAPDIPPFGGSNMPQGVWDFVDYARFFSVFLDSLGLQDIIMIGHSFGGGVALCLTALYAHISRLVVVDAAGVMQYPVWKFCSQYFFDKSFHNLAQHDFPLWLTLHKDFAVNIIRKLPQLLRGLKTAARSMMPHYEDIFSRVHVPTLVLWGDRDEVFPLAAGRQLHAAIEQSELQVIAGNHDWCLFEPERLYSLVVNFTKGV